MNWALKESKNSLNRQEGQATQVEVAEERERRKGFRSPSDLVGDRGARGWGRKIKLERELGWFEQSPKSEAQGFGWQPLGPQESWIHGL